MKTFLSVLILIFTLQSWTNAEDIKDFEIEGISIGDTALKILNRNQILEEFKIGKDEYSWTDQKCKDPEFIIYAITGQIDYKDVKKCLEKRNEIEKVFDDMFGNTKKDKWKQKHTQDETGKSAVHWIVYSFKSGDKVELVCFEMAKHMKQPSGLDVGIVSEEYRNWLNSF